MLKKLCNMMDILRGSQGCNWDKKQTLTSLKKYLLEECYELIDAIEKFEAEPSLENIQNHQEELGDILLQVIFQTHIQKENNNFSLKDVINNLESKITRRHPHIFGSAYYDPDHEENPYWEKIKAQENNSKNPFSSIAISQPGLSRANKFGEKAHKLNFDWPKISLVFDKLEEEISELKHEIQQENSQNIEEELGDILFCAAQLARKLKLDPELAIKASNKKFEKRFLFMLSQINNLENFKNLSLEQKQELWIKAKKNT